MRTLLLASAMLAVGLATPAASADELDEAEACKAAMDEPVVAPDLEPEVPEGYVECIAADELYAELIGFTSDWAACFEAADAACLGGLYADDALLAPNGEAAVRGADAIAEHYGDMFDAYGDGASARVGIRYEQVEAGETESTIVQHWRMARSGPEAADNGRESGRSLLQMRRGEDGAWRIWREFGNDFPDADPEDWPEGLY